MPTSTTAKRPLLTTPLTMLIDYDNLSALTRKRGLRHTIDYVLSNLPAALLPDRVPVSVRLYGGWYDRHRLSPVATRLAADIAKDFPAVITLYQPPSPRRVRTRVALAQSLSIDPRTVLTHTYRVRSAPPNLTPRRLPFSGCLQTTSCPLTSCHHLLKTGFCPQPHCPVTIPDTMTRPEQKLVDTMLTADLIHASLQGATEIVVVTADDDLWPGIRMALTLNATIHHVRPSGSQRGSSPYRHQQTPNYSQYNI